MEDISLPWQHKFGLMEPDEMRELARIAKSLPAGSRVLELGSFLMSSASIMAYNNPNIEILAVDLYKSKGEKLEERVRNLINQALGDGEERSLEACQNLVKEYPNIICIRNEGLDKLNWIESIDLYLEDGDHSDPYLGENLDFFTAKLKVNGFLILHDVGARWPNVRFNLERLLRSGQYQMIKQVNTLAILKKVKP